MAWVPVMLVVVGCARETGQDDGYRVTIDLGSTIRDLGNEDLFESDAAEDRLVALGPVVLPALAVALETEPAAVRVGVVEVLSQIRVQESGPLLLRAAKDPDQEVRRDALLAIGFLADTRGRAVVEAALHDPSPAVFTTAATACATLCRSPEAFGRLVEIAVHEPPVTRITAPRLTLVTVLRGGEQDRAEAVREAIRIHALPLLGRRAEPLHERTRAALLAADLGEHAAEPVLCEAVRHAHDSYLRVQAILALGTMGEGAAAFVLNELIESPDTALRAHACQALKRISERGVAAARVPTICQALESSARPPVPRRTPGGLR